MELNLDNLDPQPGETGGPATEAPDSGAGDTGGDGGKGGAADADPAAAGSDAGKPDGDGDGDGGTEAAATAKAAADAAAAEQHKQAVVPQAALAEAREQNRALRAQIAALEAQPKLTAEDRQALDDLKAAREAAKAQPVPEVDYLEDPKGYIDAGLKKLAAATESATKIATETKEQTAAREQLNQLTQTVQSQQQAFTEDNPDYPAAVTHLLTVRAAQLQLQHPTATKEQLGNQLTRELLAASAEGIKSRGNAAEYLYDMAKAGGYAKAAAAVDDKGAAAAAAAKAVAAAGSVDRDSARTLAAGGAPSGSDDDDSGEGSMPEFAQARKERFGRG